MKFPIFFEIMNIVIIWIAVIGIFLYVFMNFLRAPSDKTVEKEKRSIVETGSMIGFFLAFYLVIRLRIGVIDYFYVPIHIALMVACWFLLLLGLYVNIKGRMNLGNNWANQVRIYKHQSLVQTGVYRWVRHPLYASLIWMFYAASIIYLNWLAFLLNTFIFIPFMTYRAKQEENLLSERFKEYKMYKKNVGMFFPKLKAIFNKAQR